MVVALAATTVVVVKARPTWLRAGLRAWYYGGSDHACNICGATFGRFEQGVHTQGETQCPYCGSRPRHRTMYRYFREGSDLFSGEPRRMLHIAPEPFFTGIFQTIPNLDYLSGDIDPTVAMVQMDITDIHYPENSFDVIYCSHVLEHVTDDRKAMRELARVLKPGGWAVIAVPIIRIEPTFEDPTITDPDARRIAYGQVDHVRAYGPDFLDRLRESGFDVTVDQFARKFTYEDIVRYGLRREEIFVCRKRVE
jgi:SAM-dependent methyltransferase